MNNKEFVNICDVCGTELIGFIEGMSIGSKCPKCNEVKVVTSYYAVLSNDPTIYEVSLLPNNDANKDNLRDIANLMNISYTNAKELLIAGGLLFSGKALDVDDKIKKIRNTNLKFNIIPEYNIKIDW